MHANMSLSSNIGLSYQPICMKWTNICLTGRDIDPEYQPVCTWWNNICFIGSNIGFKLSLIITQCEETQLVYSLLQWEKEKHTYTGVNYFCSYIILMYVHPDREWGGSGSWLRQLICKVLKSVHILLRIH